MFVRYNMYKIYDNVDKNIVYDSRILRKNVNI